MQECLWLVVRFPSRSDSRVQASPIWSIPGLFNLCFSNLQGVALSFPILIHTRLTEEIEGALKKGVSFHIVWEVVPISSTYIPLHRTQTYGWRKSKCHWGIWSICGPRWIGLLGIQLATSVTYKVKLSWRKSLWCIFFSADTRVILKFVYS